MATRQLNQAIAKSTLIRTSPRKLGIVGDLIKGMKASEALAQLTFCKRRISHAVKTCLLSAIANAENNHNLNIDNLYVGKVLVGKSFTMKRMRHRARGRNARVLKPFSNLSIIVEER
jgi:large subunit ribosomal protein L22